MKKKNMDEILKGIVELGEKHLRIIEKCESIYDDHEKCKSCGAWKSQDQDCKYCGV